MATLNCTLITHHWHSGNEWQGDAAAYAGAWRSNNVDTYYTYRMRLKTPAFGGTSTSMNINFRYWRTDSGFSHTSATLRWALCKSNSSGNSYLKTYSAVSDTANQVASGIMTLTDLKPSAYGIQSTTININTSALEPVHDYYLYVWAGQSPSAGASLITIDTVSSMSATVSYTESALTSGYCQLLGQDHASNGAWTNATTPIYCNVGASTGYYYTTMLTFKTPALVCKSSNITFHLAMAQMVGTSVTLRYAICTSAANKAKYCNVYGAVSDTYQVATGTVSVTGLTTAVTYHDLSINTTALSGGQTYYLFLWANTNTAAAAVIQPQNEYIRQDEYVNHTISITSAHSYTSSVVAATCTTGGYTKYACSICGSSYTGNTTAALGHSEVNGGTASVHTKCSRCGVTLSSTHSYTSSVQTAATCTEKGTTKYACACGYSYTSQNINALGHAYVGVVTKEPTPTSDGVMTYTCSRCSVSYTAVIPRDANGAIYIDNGTNLVTYYVYVDDGSAWKLYVPFIDNGSSWDVCM